MNASNQYNEKELDDFMNDMTKRDIEVPEELHNQIVKRIDTLSKKRQIGRILLATGFSLILIFVATIRFNSDFASYASKIDFLKPIVELIRGVDRGIQNAYDHGYPMIPSVTHEEDGFIITIDKIFIDQERCRLSVTIEGEKIKNILEDNKNVGIYLNGWSHGRSYMNELSSTDDGILKVDFEYIFWNPDDFNWWLRDIDKENMNIKLGVAINKRTDDYVRQKGELIHEFDIIRIPVDESHIRESKVFAQKKSIEFDHADLHITEFVVSPTRMEVQVTIQEKKGYYINHLHSFYVRDNKGNIHQLTGTRGIVDSGNTQKLNQVTLHFVPSVYFNEDIKELYLCGGAIGYFKPGEELVTLDVDGNYPHEKIINGKKVTFYKPERNEDEDLVINFDAPTEYVFVHPKLDHPETINRNVVKKDDMTYSTEYIFDVKERSSYEFFVHGLSRKEERKVEVKLDME